MDLTGVGPIRALALAAIHNGMAAPPLLIVPLARSKAMLGRHRLGLLSQLLVGTAAIELAILPVLAVLA